MPVLEGQGVDGTGDVGPVAHGVCQRGDLGLVRYRNVEAFAAGALELQDGRFELYRRHLKQLVLHVLLCL
jgi:hypothetical protein